MTTRIKKEARELLPLLAGTVVLMVLPGLVWRGDRELLSSFTMFIFGLGCVAMAAMTFGGEFQHRTLGLLLSQPVPRAVLWREKMTVLGVALLLCFATLLACVIALSPGHNLPPEELLNLVFLPLCAFCGTPYLTLLVRSGIGGVVFAVALPGFVAGLVAAALTHWWPQVNLEFAVPSCLGVYCLVVGWRGYRRFVHFELKDGAAEMPVLPARAERLLARGLGWAVPRTTGPWLALVKKEARQQQVSFLLAGLFTSLVAIGVLVIRYSPAWGQGLLTIGFSIYMLLVPFIVGALAVAEERALGIAEWHLTLPASARKQWATKMLVALLVSAVLGLLLPALFGLVGAALLPGPESGTNFPSPHESVVIVLYHALATTLAMYAATVCGTTIRAILAAFGFIVAGASVVAGIGNRMLSWGERQGLQVHSAGLLHWGLWCAAAMVMICLVQRLSYRNFRRCGVPGLHWVGQFALVLLAWAALVAGGVAVLLFV